MCGVNTRVCVFREREREIGRERRKEREDEIEREERDGGRDRKR